MAELKLKSTEPKLETDRFTLSHDRAEHPSGVVLDRQIILNPPAAVMLAARDEAVLLIRQYRLPPRMYLWELPAGRCDPGENPLETAKRELIEETGYRAHLWRTLLSFYPAPGFASELMHSFLAQDLTAGEAEPEQYELIETRWFDRAEALKMIERGEIRDGKTVATLLYYESFVVKQS